jgi:NitT/TauT family transport system substrate-binding protein
VSGRRRSVSRRRVGMPVRVRLQLDWYPEIESGGYYQARALGFYAAQGLAVEYSPANRGNQKWRTLPRVAPTSARLTATTWSWLSLRGFATGDRGRGDAAQSAGADVSPHASAEQLQGYRWPRAYRQCRCRVWWIFLQRSQRVRFDLTPVGPNMANFVADESLVRECFATQEPYLPRRWGRRSGFSCWRMRATTPTA